MTGPMRVDVDVVCAQAQPKRTRCKTCRRAIFFVTLATSRKQTPLDWKPDGDAGSVLWPWGYDHDAAVILAKVLRRGERDAFRGPRFRLYVPHLQTCPQAVAFRRRQ